MKERNQIIGFLKYSDKFYWRLSREAVSALGSHGKGFELAGVDLVTQLWT